MSKLSDIFGRKIVLLSCYFVFACGNLVSGIAGEMWHVVAGRTIAGVGGAGMSVIVSILITGNRFDKP
jgi:MFS family permease